MSNEAFYTWLGLKEDFTIEVLAIINIPQESALGWQEALQGIKDRGVKNVGLFVCYDPSGLEEAIYNVYSRSKQQSCTLHLQRNLLNQVRKRDRNECSQQMKAVFSPDDPVYTNDKAVEKFKHFISDWQEKYPVLNKYHKRKNLHRYFTYLEYDYRIRRMIYTTNWIERLNKSFRRTLK